MLNIGLHYLFLNVRIACTLEDPTVFHVDIQTTETLRNLAVVTLVYTLMCECKRMQPFKAGLAAVDL